MARRQGKPSSFAPRTGEGAPESEAQAGAPDASTDDVRTDDLSRSEGQDPHARHDALAALKQEMEVREQSLRGREQELEVRELALDEREQELDDHELAVDARERAIEVMERALDARDEELSIREAAADEALSLVDEIMNAGTHDNAGGGESAARSADDASAELATLRDELLSVQDAMRKLQEQLRSTQSPPALPTEASEALPVGGTPLRIRRKVGLTPIEAVTPTPDSKRVPTPPLRSTPAAPPPQAPADEPLQLRAPSMSAAAAPSAVVPDRTTENDSPRRSRVRGVEATGSHPSAIAAEAIGSPARPADGDDASASDVSLGALPLYFASEGLKRLRKGDFDGATEYYRQEAARAPSRAEGWLGMAAAAFGSGDLKTATQYLNKGAAIDSTFPVGALMSDARPARPDLLFELANESMAGDEAISYQNAVAILNEIVNTPTAPRQMRKRAEGMVRRCRGRLEELRLAHPKLLAMKREAERQKLVQRLRLYLIVCIAAIGIGGGGWIAYTYSQWMVHSRQGLAHYRSAYRMINLGPNAVETADSGSDAVDLYAQACADFHEAQQYRKGEFTAHYMAVKAGEAVLDLANAGKVRHALSPLTLSQIQVTIRDSTAVMRELDPSGTQAVKEQVELDEYLR